MGESTSHLPLGEESYPGPEAIENWINFPREELARYEGLYIAYNWDCTRIVAAAETRELLRQKLREAGIDPRRVLHGFAGPS
jgi:hypothetical protein